MTHFLTVPTRILRPVGGAGILALAALVSFSARAEPSSLAASPKAAALAQGPGVAVRSVAEWLLRLHEASVRRAYVGTYVVSARGNLSSAKIWHVCDGTQQMERVETLTGTPKSTFRHNDHVVTFFPTTRLARVENRTTLGLFPGLLVSSGAKVDEHYLASRTGHERVAGVDAEVVQLRAKDDWRFGYRLWVETGTGLVVKMQTLDSAGEVLEQMAFTELQLGAPVKMDRLLQMMANTEGYRVERLDLEATTPAAEGWSMRRAIDGFKSMSCFRRQPSPPGAGAAPSMPGPGTATVQWIFSDGLASVSLFIEPYDRQRHVQEGTVAEGATRTLTRRHQDWWVTAVGEVPLPTLQAFVGNLGRTK